MAENETQPHDSAYYYGSLIRICHSIRMISICVYSREAVSQSRKLAFAFGERRGVVHLLLKVNWYDFRLG